MERESERERVGQRECESERLKEWEGEGLDIVGKEEIFRPIFDGNKFCQKNSSVEKLVSISNFMTSIFANFSIDTKLSEDLSKILIDIPTKL